MNFDYTNILEKYGIVRLMKSNKDLERIIKGVANHRRIELLKTISSKPELSVQDLASVLDTDFRTIAAHLQKLTIAGLIMKRNDGVSVRHKLTDRGKDVLMFLRNIV